MTFKVLTLPAQRRAAPGECETRLAISLISSWLDQVIPSAGVTLLPSTLERKHYTFLHAWISYGIPSVVTRLLQKKSFTVSLTYIEHYRSLKTEVTGFTHKTQVLHVARKQLEKCFYAEELSFFQLQPGGILTSLCTGLLQQENHKRKMV